MAAKAKSSEVDAYVFIKDRLRMLGWDTRNPERVPSGQVWTQNECLGHPEIKKRLGLQKPENIVRVRESVVWVIEAKRSHKQLEQAIEEARDYANAINSSNTMKALFISGVAGNEVDSYLVRTQFMVSGEFRPITMNGKEISSLISCEVAKKVLESGPDMRDVVVDEGVFLGAAERINQILHLGAINKNYRASVMAGLLLSLVDDTPPNIDAAPTVLIGEINNRAHRVLRKEGKPEFNKYLELRLPATEDNHAKFKQALVDTLQELNNLNIRSAMNSGTDVLGKFYEVFLKYGNGAKEIGIVLTPRHITKFAVDVMGINDRDIVLDPACGTAGFLVAAFDEVKRSYSRERINRFKENNLFGIEQEPEVVALAIVNMIFRGDGKNNIVEGNCFQKNLVMTTRSNAVTAKWASEKPEPDHLGVTKVLMNPPFALKRSDEKEYRFVDYALGQMQDGGLLFSVLPYSAMVKPGAYKEWRMHRLLGSNSLVAVITFPEDLFYPIGVHTVGVFIRKGMAHSVKQSVLWMRAINDGLLKSKGKRLPNARATNDFPEMVNVMKSFLVNPTMQVANVECFQKACPIDFSDPLLELVPENYLDQEPPGPDELADGIEQVIRDSVAFLIRARKEENGEVDTNAD